MSFRAGSLQSLTPQRRRALGATAVLLGVLTVAASVSWWVSREPPVTPVTQSAPGPVLLVPGYGGSTTALEVLGAALIAEGRDVTIVSLAGDGTGDLRKQAEVLDRAADETLDQSGAGSVDVVGYSAGGVIARLWVAEFGGGNVARRVVSLGSPHHGTDIAAFAAALTSTECPTACQQLATTSDLLRDLNAGDESPEGPVWVSMWSSTDELVIPPQTAALEGAVNFSIQDVCGGAPIAHGDIPATDAVIELTIQALAVEVPTPPAPGDC